jgi:hypothetical protein
MSAARQHSTHGPHTPLPLPPPRPPAEPLPRGQRGSASASAGMLAQMQRRRLEQTVVLADGTVLERVERDQISMLPDGQVLSCRGGVLYDAAYEAEEERHFRAQRERLLAKWGSEEAYTAHLDAQTARLRRDHAERIRGRRLAMVATVRRAPRLSRPVRRSRTTTATRTRRALTRRLTRVCSTRAGPDDDPDDPGPAGLATRRAGQAKVDRRSPSALKRGGAREFHADSRGVARLGRRLALVWQAEVPDRPAQVRACRASSALAADRAPGVPPACRRARPPEHGARLPRALWVAAAVMFAHALCLAKDYAIPGYTCCGYLAATVAKQVAERPDGRRLSRGRQLTAW